MSQQRHGSLITSRPSCVNFTGFWFISASIVYKLAVIVYKCMHGLAPRYLAADCVPVTHWTSTVNGENPGSRPRWSVHTSWTTPQSDNQALLSLDNSGRSWTVSALDKVTAVPVRRNGNFQTPISVPVVRPKRCHTLSNPAHRQDYTVACLKYTLQTMMPLPGWPVMAPNAYDNNDNIWLLTVCLSPQWRADDISSLMCPAALLSLSKNSTWHEELCSRQDIAGERLQNRCTAL